MFYIYIYIHHIIYYISISCYELYYIVKLYQLFKYFIDYNILKLQFFNNIFIKVYL